MHKHILRSLILVTGLMMIRPVAAIDGNYGIPYAQTGNGIVPGGSAYGRKVMQLPLLTFAGGILVVLGASGALYWQIKSARRRQAGQT